MTTSDLPVLNASLNGLAGVLLLAGFVFIKRRRIAQHKACMIAAVVVSAMFLVSYVVYHALHGSTAFARSGPIRAVYFFILITHVVLATAVVPLVLLTLRRAWKEQFDRHRRLARWTWPIWMYVSVTGVVVYLMLYQF